MKLREDVIALGATTAASLLWRVGGTLHLTVVVKATFRLVPDGRMVSWAPQPIHQEDVLLTRGAGVIAPSDAAPYLGKTDVLLAASAEPQGAPLRLVVRSAETLLDKSGTFSSLGVRADLAEDRRKLATRLSAALEADIPELPLDMDWGVFQAAPRDQRLPYLSGHEWLLLRGVTSRGLARSQLPGAAGAIWVGPRGGSRDGGFSVAAFADRMVIDGTAETVTLSFRGAFPIESTAMLSRLVIAAGVELPGEPIAWERAIPRIAGSDITALHLSLHGELSFSAFSAEASALGSATTSVRDATAPHGSADANDALDATIGIASVAAQSAADTSLEGTIGIAELVAAEAVTPFPLPKPGARASLVPLPFPGAPWTKSKACHNALEAAHSVGGVPDESLDGTLGLATAPASPALPFAGTASAPPPSTSRSVADLRGATSELSPEAAAAVWAEAGLPFPSAREPTTAARAPSSPWAARRVASAAEHHAQISAQLRRDAALAAPVVRPPPAMEPASGSPSPVGLLQQRGDPEREDDAFAIDPATAPAPPEGASHGEEFLAALAWLSENKSG
jgi:hypothetical protein